MADFNETWVSQDGSTIAIKDMATQHIVNAIGHCDANIREWERTGSVYRALNSDESRLLDWYRGKRDALHQELKGRTFDNITRIRSTYGLDGKADQWNICQMRKDILFLLHRLDEESGRRARE